MDELNTHLKKLEQEQLSKQIKEEGIDIDAIKN